jgi:hypothetical protein
MKFKLAALSVSVLLLANIATPAHAVTTVVTGDGRVTCLGGTLSDFQFVTPIKPLIKEVSGDLQIETREVLLVDSKTKTIWTTKGQRTIRTTNTVRKIASKKTILFYPTMSATCSKQDPLPSPTPTATPSVTPTPTQTSTPVDSSPTPTVTPSASPNVSQVSPTPVAQSTPQPTSITSPVPSSTNTIPPTVRGTTIKRQGWGSVTCPATWAIGTRQVLSYKQNSIPPRPGNTGYFDVDYVNSISANTWTVTWKRTVMTTYMSTSLKPKIRFEDFKPLLEVSCVKQ